jgi:hypothetical protein
VLSILRDIVELFTNIPGYILYAVETIINLVFSGIQAIFTVITVIPLPEVPSPPEFIDNLNWFYPVGAVVTIMGPIVVGYIAFLLVRWIFKWAGEL